MAAQGVGALDQAAQRVVLVQRAVASRVGGADALAGGVIRLSLHSGLALAEVLGDGGLPVSLVVLVGFFVGGVVDHGEQAGQGAAFWPVFVGGDVAGRVLGLADSAQAVVGGGGGKAACAGGFDGPAGLVVFSAQALSFALAGGDDFDDLPACVVADMLDFAFCRGALDSASPRVVGVAEGFTQRVGDVGEVARWVVAQSCGVAQGVGLRDGLALAVVAGSAGAAQPVCGLNQVALLVVFVASGDGVRPFAITCACGAGFELAVLVVGA